MTVEQEELCSSLASDVQYVATSIDIWISENKNDKQTGAGHEDKE